MGKKKNDLTGQRFGKLLVLKEDKKHIMPSGGYVSKWLCQCDCSNVVSVMGCALTRNNKPTRSCGCVSREFVRTLTKPKMNLIGKRFGRLVVIDTAEDYIISSGKHYAVWKCRCDCGNIKNVKQQKLLSGTTRSCGCFKRENTSKLKSANLIGQRFGKLNVLERIDFDNSGVWWLCKCDCGSYKKIRSNGLLSGDYKSCGCIKSFGEKEIREYLNNNHIDFTTQYWFNDLRNNDTNAPLYFDFAIFKDNHLDCLLEFNGEQHYRDCGNFGRLQREKTDALKEQYCKKHQISLHIIKYDENIQSALNQIIY